MKFDLEWKKWLRKNLKAGKDKNGIFKVLLDSGFEYNAIKRQMKFEPTLPVDKLVNPLRAATGISSRTDTTHAYSGQNTNVHPRLFLPNAQRFASDKLELYRVDGFLTPDECEQLVERIRSKLKPSALSSYEPDSTYRTSRTCELAGLGDETVEKIDTQICSYLGLHPSYSEAIQGQYYEAGDRFKQHTDYFEAHELTEHGARMGQRTYTFMIYLNDVEDGGETEFKNLGVSFKPKAGTAIIWNSLDANGRPNTNSLHEAHPVGSGYKAIITKWFRCGSHDQKAPPLLLKERNEFIPNYTRVGFKKERLNHELFAKIASFYKSGLNRQTEEHVDGGFIFNADGAKKRVSSTVIDLPQVLRHEIHAAIKDAAEQWCGKILEPTYVYGIRIYKEGAILKLHRDRIETHIISAIINVDQEVNEDWPLVIEDNFYRQHSVYLKPGEIVLYEGGRLKHGRPIPLSGSSFANIFCHFKPVDYDVRYY